MKIEETKINKEKRVIRFIIMILIEFPFIFIIIPLLMIILNNYFSLLVIKNVYFTIIGIIILILGLLVIIISSHALLIKPKQLMFSPTKALDKFIVNGIYQKSRNPMYIGYFLVILAEFFLLGDVLILVYLIVLILVVQILLVFMEEPSLKRAFGEEYEKYCKKVPRWF